MKIIKIITHPLTIIISFVLLLISGEHLGGFYIQYIIIALPHGGIHAILAAAGIAALLVSKYLVKLDDNYLPKPVLNITGAIILPLSLFYFFHNDREHYNYFTFYQTVPLVIMGIFGLLLIIFMISNFLKILRQLRT